MKFEVRWIADFRDDTHLAVHYRPVYEGLGERAGESLQQHQAFTPFPPQVAGDVAMLEGLAESLADTAMQPLEGLPWSVEPHLIERDVTESFGPRGRQYWLRFDFFMVHSIGAGERRWHEWGKSELTKDMMDLVKRIDEFACVEASVHWADHFNEFAEREDVIKRFSKPVHSFLSYRAQPDMKLFARKLHDAISATGDPSFLPVFMDELDLWSGEWRDQLEEHLNDSDVFLPLLTPDYLGGNALWELEIAEALKNEGRLEIIPVLVEGEWADYPRLAAR